MHILSDDTYPAKVLFVPSLKPSQDRRVQPRYFVPSLNPVTLDASRCALISTRYAKTDRQPAAPRQPTSNKKATPAFGGCFLSHSIRALASLLLANPSAFSLACLLACLPELARVPETMRSPLSRRARASTPASPDDCVRERERRPRTDECDPSAAGLCASLLLPCA